MLVLTRKEGQRIYLFKGDEILVVDVSEIQHGQVKIALGADQSYTIIRDDLLTDDQRRRAEAKYEVK